MQPTSETPPHVNEFSVSIGNTGMFGRIETDKIRLHFLPDDKLEKSIEHRYQNTIKLYTALVSLGNWLANQYEYRNLPIRFKEATFGLFNSLRVMCANLEKVTGLENIFHGRTSWTEEIGAQFGLSESEYIDFVGGPTQAVYEIKIDPSKLSQAIIYLQEHPELKEQTLLFSRLEAPQALAVLNTLDDNVNIE